MIARPALFGALVMAVVITGVVGVVTVGTPIFGIGLSLPSLSVPGTGRAPDATENFLKGYQTSNGELVWNSYSQEIQDRFRNQGRTKYDIQRQLENSAAQGAKYEQLNYVGGQNLPDGTSMQFYVVGIRTAQRSNDVNFVPYVFYLNRVGKIERIL